MTYTVMTPVYANAVNLQNDCPLFSKIPKEIRDLIFGLVMTPHDKRHVPYPEELRYGRPGFPNADRKLPLTLLRCCQLIYLETRDLPAKKYVQVDWIRERENGHGPDDKNRFERFFPTALRNLHLLTTKTWLEQAIDLIWARYTQFVATQAPNLEYLRITLEHDNSPFSTEDDTVPNPKKRGTLRLKGMKNSDPFEETSWGYQFRAFESLKVMELEVETLEEKMEKLNLVVAKTAGWRFPLAKGKELVFNPRKTKWEGWHGPNLGQRMTVSYHNTPGLFVGSYSFIPMPGAHKDPTGARKRLTEAGVDFTPIEDAPEYTSDDCETYCGVTLVFEAT